MKPIVIQEWEERERGWGIRPDGFSLHLTNVECLDFIAEYWKEEQKRNPSGHVPDEYTTTCGSPQIVDVKDFVYNALLRAQKKNLKGIRVYCRSIKEIENERAVQSIEWIANDAAKQLDCLDKQTNIPQHIYIWKFKDAPEEFRNLAGVDNCEFIAYIPEAQKKGRPPFKSKDHFVLSNGGELDFF